MLLLWCLSMIEFSPSLLGGRSFHLFVDLKQAIVSVSGRISPQVWDVFLKPTTSFFFRCWFFQQLRSILLRKDALYNSFMVGDVGFILRSIHSNYLTIMHCFRRLCDVALFDQSSCFVKIMYFFLSYPFSRSVVFSFEFSHLIKFFSPSSTGVRSEIFFPLVPFLH